MWKPFDHEKAIECSERRAERLGNQEVEEVSCGVDIMGAYHTDGRCNTCSWSEYLDEYCWVEYACQARIEAEKLNWLSPMLEYFWQVGIHGDGRSFLYDARFIHKYRGVFANHSLLI